MALPVERVTAIGPYGNPQNGPSKRSYRPFDPDKVIASWWKDPAVVGILFGMEHGVVDIHHFIIEQLIPLATTHSVGGLSKKKSG